jgi:hypothetical protein
MQALSLPIEIVNCILSFNDKELYRNKHTKQRHIRIKQKYMDDTFSYLFKNMKKDILTVNCIFLRNFHNSLFKVYRFTKWTLLEYENIKSNYQSDYHCNTMTVIEVDIPIMGLNPEEFYVEECYSALRSYSGTIYAETTTFNVRRKWDKCV